MAKYYSYKIKALSPVRIADDSTSQSGQTDTLTYIPGSAVRGLVISALADQGTLDTYKKQLFSDKVCFMNAYLSTGQHALMPSIKGFYEDKTITDKEKKIENVVIDGEFTDGLKRASLGRYCYVGESLEYPGNRAVYYYSVATGSDLKIKIHLKGAKDENGEKKQSVFRNEYMEAGQVFAGAIRLDGNEALTKEISELLKKGKILHIGSSRTAGLGKCKVLEGNIVDDIPFYQSGAQAAGACYMMLLSDTVMRDENGEYAGLNLPELEKKLGVSNLKVKYASTSLRNVRGYNRTIGTKLPSVPMYAAGSVFHLEYEGVITEEKMRAVCDEGLGVRKNEGYGRVLFLKDYEEIRYKHSCIYSYKDASDSDAESKITEEDKETLKIAANGRYHRILEDGLKVYVLEHILPVGGLSASQIGTFRSILMAHQYTPQEAKRNLDNFFAHAADKEENQNIQKQKASFGSLKREVDRVFGQSLKDTLFGADDPLKGTGKVFGVAVSEFFTKEDEDRYKAKLLVEMARFKGKKED